MPRNNNVTVLNGWPDIVLIEHVRADVDGAYTTDKSEKIAANPASSVSLEWYSNEEMVANIKLLDGTEIDHVPYSCFRLA